MKKYREVLIALAGLFWKVLQLVVLVGGLAFMIVKNFF